MSGQELLDAAAKGAGDERRVTSALLALPFARGGPATPENIALRCRAHNRYEGEQCFGRRVSGAGSQV
jgi:hypothetical protein